MELLLIIIVLLAIIYLHFKPRKSFPLHEQLKDPLESLVKPVIEDSSLLKAELAATQEKLSQLNRDMGQLQSENQRLFFELQTTCASHEQLSSDLKKVTSQKKSGEVRLGMVSEQLIPLLPEFPVPISTLKFFGNPIDYISIDLDAELISFIEVKSGGSVLSEKQRKIRKMIQEKKVQFIEVRLDENGVKVK